MSDGTQAKKVIPWIIAIALFMETLDVTILVTAIPKMALSFMVDPIDLKFALTGYLLSLALFIPVSGWVADKWGTQRTFLFALLVFTIGSMGCGMASSLLELVIGRIVQGLGGAFMMPVGRLIMLRTFAKSELVKAMNYMTTPALLGPLLGPVVGGFITTYYSWPWIFYVNVPMGILGLVATFYYIKNNKLKEVRPFDTLGFLLFGISLAGLFFVFEVFNETFMPAYVSILCCVGALIGFSLFYWHYKKATDPVLNLKLFSIRTFFIAACGNVWIRQGISSVAFLLPLFFQIGYGLDPMHSGLLICIWTLGMITMKFFNKAILKRFGFRKTLIFTSVLTGITIVAFSFITKINIPLVAGLIFINGFVSSLQFMGMNVLYYVDVPPSDMSQATAIASTVQQLSMGFGIAFSAFVLQVFIGWHHPLLLNKPEPFRYAFLVMGSIAALSALIFLKLQPSDGHEVAS